MKMNYNVFQMQQAVSQKIRKEDLLIVLHYIYYTMDNSYYDELINLI